MNFNPVNGQTYNFNIPEYVEYNSIQYTVTAIGRRSFFDLGSVCKIESMTLPKTIEILEERAFDLCLLENILSINNVKEMHALSFASNYFKTVKLPKSLYLLQDGCFSYCIYLEKIEIDETSTFFSLDSKGSLYNYDKTYIYWIHKDPVITFPPLIKSIPAWLFGRHTSLISIEIPATIIEIGMAAFEGCLSLEEVIIKGNIQYIDETCFNQCGSLKTITYYGWNFIGEISFDNPNAIYVYVCKYYKSDKCFGLNVNKVNDNCPILPRTFPCGQPKRLYKPLYI